MTQQEALEHFQKIAEEVSNWPEWKQRLLKDSLEPELPIPRSPVPTEEAQHAAQEMPEDTLAKSATANCL